MPLTGILKGDFSSFIDAVSKAEVALKGFEGDAGKVQTSLNKMADSFSGKKIISDAELATKAVTEIGGATKLTASEQAKLNAILTEAIAKYTALGAEAPKDMVALAEATKGANKASVDILGTVGKLAGAIGIGFSVGAVVNFAGKVFDTAAHIKDLSDKLGISTDAIQGFSYAAAQGGSDIDAVGASLEKMNEKLAIGDKSTVSALDDLGIKFADIRRMKPEDAFLAITDQIEKINDPMDQARLAVELFGKRGAELLPAIRDGFRDTSGAASKMSNETIKSLEAAQQAWENLGRQAIIVTGNMIIEIEKVGRSLISMPKQTASWLLFLENTVKFGPGVAAAMNSIAEGAAKAAAAVSSVPAPAAATGGKPALTQEQEDAIKRQADLLKTLRDELFGRNLQTAAQNYTAALGSIANLSKVNVVEQEKINKSIGEALDVYARFGKVAPQAMRDLYIATAKMPDAIAGIPASVGKVGYEFDLLNPKIVDAGTLLNYVAGIPFGVKVGQQVDLVPPKLEKFRGNLGDLSRAMSELAQVSGGAFGTIASGLATLVSSANAAKTAIASIKDAQKALKAGEAMEGILGMSTGIAGLVTAAVAAGQAIKALFGLFDRNKGRDVVVDFAESFGGFDALHVKLLELGADGEALWVKLTQGVGRNNPAQAQRVIDEVTQALDDQAAKSDEAKSATEEQAQATIETATEAAKALEELGGKLDISKDQWKDWGLVVTGVLQEIANTVRSLPMPSPAGALPFSAGSGGSSGNGSTAVLAPIVIQAGSEVLARQVVKTFVRNGL